MKNNSFFTVILILSFLTVSSQSCLPEGIGFTAQAQIDSFQINYPGCTEIEGDVYISGNDITNLNGLSVLTSIGGHLYIGDNDALNSLTGLDNMTSIGGGLGIGVNDALISLSGLDNVTSIGVFLAITDNNALTSLTGLDIVSSIGGDLVIGYNDALTSLAGLDNMTSIGGDFWIEGNNALTSLAGLVKVTSIGGGLEIDYNNTLISLVGLDNIEATSISSLYIYDNYSLSTCEVQSICDYLLAPNGETYIDENAMGCNSQEEVEEACEDFSVEEQFIGDYLSLFPNPAKDEVKLILDGFVIDEVNIYAFTGQQVLHERSVDGTIDISHLQPGMYIVEVTIENTRLRQKLLVQR